MEVNFTEGYEIIDVDNFESVLIAAQVAGFPEEEKVALKIHSNGVDRYVHVSGVNQKDRQILYRSVGKKIVFTDNKIKIES